MNVLKFSFYILIYNLLNVVSANTYLSLDYTITPLDQLDVPALKVDIHIQGTLSDKLILDLPNRWADVDYHDQVKNIKIVNSKNSFKIIKKKNKHQLILMLSNTNSLHLCYEIHQKKQDSLNVHQVIVRQDLIHAPGYGLFAVPHDLKPVRKIPMTVSWQKLPKHWKTLSDHGVEQTMQFSGDISELLHGIYVAGNVRLYQISKAKSPVYLSLYGRFDSTDQNIINFLGEIIESQRKFFKDSDFSKYVISLIEGDNPHSMGGTKFHHSFTAYIPQGIEQNRYYMLFAHEHLHNWIGGKIRNNYQNELNYWWTEGFTEYYTRVLALRSNSITLQEFIDQCNEFLDNYYLSPVVNEPNIRIKKDFWNNYDIEKLPYYRGFVFALYLNGLIKQNNPAHSLDKVMHDLFKTAKTHKFSMDYFQRLTQAYLPQGIKNEIINLIGKGQTIDLQVLFSLLPLEKIAFGCYDPGFDREFFIKHQTIRNLNDKSNAYKAGLRNGDKITDFSVPKGQTPNQIITLKMLNKTISFKPENSHKKNVYHLKSDLSDSNTKSIKQFFDVQY